jgi:trigger factor
MSYTIEDVNECTKKLVFSFEELDLTTEIKEAVSKKRKSVSLKGFRKGKAPLDMVERLYGPQIETEAINSFVQNQFFEAVNKEGLRVVGYPSFENMKFERGKSVSFDALVEIFPEVSLVDYKGWQFAKESTDVADDDLDNLTKNYLGSKAEMVEVTDAQNGFSNWSFCSFKFCWDTRGWKSA